MKYLITMEEKMTIWYKSSTNLLMTLITQFRDFGRIRYKFYKF